MINWKIAVCLGACVAGKNITFAQSDTSQQKNIIAPVRIAFLPGLSSQGKNDKYTTSHFSLNVLGGITGGIKGVELGTLFNINKKSMQGVQAAGWFNMTNGNVNGIQMAGWFNVTGG